MTIHIVHGLLPSGSEQHEVLLFESIQREPTCNIVVMWVKIFQTELMPEIYSKSPVRAIGKVLLVKFS